MDPIIIQRILELINVFETGSKGGNYDALTIAADNPRRGLQITFGRSQACEFGGLPLLLHNYTGNSGLLADKFYPYFNYLGKFDPKNNSVLSSNMDFIALLKDSGNDIIMQKTQDVFFKQRYFNPAFDWFSNHEFKLSLSLAIIYDSFIQSGSILGFLRDKIIESNPTSGGDEKEWMKQYILMRYKWFKNSFLKICAYRPMTFYEQIKMNNWDLSQPITVYYQDRKGKLYASNMII